MLVQILHVSMQLLVRLNCQPTLVCCPGNIVTPAALPPTPVGPLNGAPEN